MPEGMHGSSQRLLHVIEAWLSCDWRCSLQTGYRAELQDVEPGASG